MDFGALMSLDSTLWGIMFALVSWVKNSGKREPCSWCFICQLQAIVRVSVESYLFNLTAPLLPLEQRHISITVQTRYPLYHDRQVFCEPDQNGKNIKLQISNAIARKISLYDNPVTSTSSDDHCFVNHFSDAELLENVLDKDFEIEDDELDDKSESGEEDFLVHGSDRIIPKCYVASTHESIFMVSENC